MAALRRPYGAFRMARRHATVAAVVAAALVGTLALAGCTSADEATSAPGSEDMAPQMGGDGGAADAYAGPEAEQRAAGPGQPAPGAPEADSAGSQGRSVVEERSLIYTGTITVQVESVVRSADEAIALAVGAGGFVAGDTRYIEETGSQATLVLRVPAERFTSTLDALARLGEEQTRQVNAEDVTETLIDLDARIATQQASVNRVRDLLARANTIAEIVTLETELTSRQAELDSLTQRREGLSGLVDLATITVVLHGESGPVVEEEEEEIGFLAGLRSGWKGFLASVKVVLTVAGWLLPWAIAIGVPVWAVLWVLRVRRRRAQQPPPTPASE